MLLAVGDLGVATCPPGLEVLLPLLFEICTPPGVVVLCSFHGPQYVPSAVSLPGGVNLTNTSVVGRPARGKKKGERFDKSVGAPECQDFGPFCG
jgi:hypothetical protein